jgi:hypothetical protein
MGGKVRSKEVQELQSVSDDEKPLPSKAMTEHKERLIRVLEKQLTRTDSKRATGIHRKEIIKRIQEIKDNEKDNDSAGNIQSAPQKDD